MHRTVIFPRPSEFRKARSKSNFIICGSVIDGCCVMKLRTPWKIRAKWTTKSATSARRLPREIPRSDEKFPRSLGLAIGDGGKTARDQWQKGGKKKGMNNGVGGDL